MIMNPFVMKRYAALISPAVVTTMLFFIAFMFYGLVYGVVFFVVGLLISVVLGSLLLRNPFRAILEGKGILALNIDSTGIIRPFIVNVDSPYIRGKQNNRKVDDVFDRKTVHSIAVPKKVEKSLIRCEQGGVIIQITNDDYNEGRFALFHYPCVIWNEQLNTILSKGWLSELEKDSFAEHGVLYLNRKVEELTSAIRDFGRHVVESLKPKAELLQNKWVWVIIVVFLIAIAILFGPTIIKAANGFMGSAKSTIGGAFTPQ